MTPFRNHPMIESLLNACRKLVSIAAFIMMGNAHAIVPESGWWWNDAEGGRGYAIEIQDDQIFFTSFTYDGNGLPIWYYSFGKLTGDRNYSGRVLRSTQGACFGCTQKAPITVDVGAMTLSFSSATNASLSLLGFKTELKRFDFTPGQDNTKIPGACYGEWSAVIGSASFPVYYGERLRFSSTYNSTTLSGSRKGDSSDIALCSYDASTRSWSILLDSSASYYQFFSFKFTGFNSIEGSHWTILKGSTLSGSGTNFVAYRTASKSAVQGLGGPAKAQALQGSLNESTDAQMTQDRALAESTKSNVPAPPEIQDAATRALLSFPRQPPSSFR